MKYIIKIIELIHNTLVFLLFLMLSIGVLSFFIIIFLLITYELVHLSKLTYQYITQFGSIFFIKMVLIWIIFPLISLWILEKIGSKLLIYFLRKGRLDE